MVEPLEETRSELIFATEPLLFSLYLATPNSPRSTATIELDEVEVRHKALQQCNGVSPAVDFRFVKAFCRYAKGFPSYTPPHDLFTPTYGRIAY